MRVVACAQPVLPVATCEQRFGRQPDGADNQRAVGRHFQRTTPTA